MAKTSPRTTAHSASSRGWPPGWTPYAPLWGSGEAFIHCRYLAIARPPQKLLYAASGGIIHISAITAAKIQTASLQRALDCQVSATLAHQLWRGTACWIRAMCHPVSERQCLLGAGSMLTQPPNIATATATASLEALPAG